MGDEFEDLTLPISCLVHETEDESAEGEETSESQPTGSSLHDHSCKIKEMVRLMLRAQEAFEIKRT